jgi:signal transduction histidine kinase/ligand-binding sensor domain-containing protein
VGIHILLHKVKRADRRLTSVIALGILLACCPCAFALDPSLDVSQYAHTAWKNGEGVSEGMIRSIAQTADGYLWLGTEFGLRRFDGVRAVPWEPPAGQQLPSSDIRSLQGARDGRLWIGTFRGLASWKDGKLSHYPELDGQVIEALLEDREGTIWVAGWAPSVGRLCRIQGGNIQCYGEDGRFGSGVTSLYEDSEGNLWAGAMNGLWRWKSGPPRLYPMSDPAQRIYALAESDDGGILIAKHSGITKLRNGKTEAYLLPAGLQFQPHRLLRDRNGGLWIGALVDSGLLHIHERKADLFTTANGLSGASVSALLEDREGSIWVATVDGLDRFREFAIPTISVQQGLSSQGVGSILAARDGSLWLGTSEGLNRWNQGEITVYRNRREPDFRGASQPTGLTVERGAHWKRTVREITDSGLPERIAESIFQDNSGQIWVGTQSGVAFLKSGRFVPVASVPYGVVHSITGDSAGNLWMSHQEGLFHLLEARLVERIPWAKLGRREPATAVLHDARQGGLWLGFRDGGVAYFNDGQISASYAAAEGLGEGMIRSFYPDASGSLWAATDGGLSRIKDGRVLTLSSRNGLPCNTVHWMMEDDTHSVWLYTACGLVRIARSELDAWASNPKQTIQAAVFDSSDGVSSHLYPGGYSANVAKSADGKLWFLRLGGVSVLDPHHLAFNKLPPPVHIEQLTADSKTYDASNGLRLPAGVRDLLFDFTALSFVAPEKVRIRVKLEGQDKDWRELINQRHVHYTNLPPRTYRFRVMACNNSGVWNEEGDFLDFSIAPAFYQRTSFRILCVLVFLGALFAAYRLRVRQLEHQFNKTLDVRVSERTRIARELHDTLLQSFQGLLLRFQSVLKILPERPLEARQRLESAMEQAAAAITEGRDAVRGLRSSALETNDLANGIIAIGRELTSDASAPDPPTIEVEVEGGPRQLNPIVRDEAYRIAGEALRNAFRHAQARRISVEIRYDKRHFHLTVRDDGKGIADEAMLQQPAGHFGLHGMRERAEIVGGRLEVWSRPYTGTEVELSVPGAVAYGTSSEPSWFSRVFSGKSRSAGRASHE